MKKIIIIFILFLSFSSCNLQNKNTGDLENTKQGNIEENNKEDVKNIDSMTENTKTGEIIKKQVGEKEKISTVKNTSTGKIEILDSKEDGVVLDLKTNKYCLFDTCLKGEILALNDKYISRNYEGLGEKIDIKPTKQSYKENPDEFSILKKDKSFLKNIIRMGMGSEIVYINKGKGDYFIKNVFISGCGGKNIDQRFYDDKGKELDDSKAQKEILSDYTGLERFIKIGNISYILGVNIKEKAGLLSINEVEFLEDEYTTSNSIKKYIENQIYNEKKLYKKYIIPINKDSRIYISYTAKIDQPSRIVFLGTDNNWLGQNISSNGDFLNLELTNKIIGYYKENSAIGLTTGESKRIYKIKQKDIPVFNVKKLDNKGNYMLYPKKPYTFQIFAEMCKPAVYVYNDKKIDNKIIIDTKKGNYFTKLIPEFNIDNGWGFSSKDGLVYIEKDRFDYLYYAIKIRGYKHNEDGWIVLGKNVRDFFKDKLDKINFNIKEKQDFLEYWIPKYEKNKYYFISFKYKEELDKLVGFKFSKEPDNIFRVLLDSYELDKLTPENKRYLYSNIGDNFDKYLIKRFDRNKGNYEVFEWGGVLQKDAEFIVY